MDDNCGEWVESMGVVSRRWMWVESMGVVVRRYRNSGNFWRPNIFVGPTNDEM